MFPTDTVLICRDCGGPFTFSDDERGTFAARGHVHPPSRCLACREVRRTRQAESGGRRASPGFREFRQVQSTVACSSCHEPAIVPFTVRADRPVYCSACFQRRRAAAVDA